MKIAPTPKITEGEGRLNDFNSVQFSTLWPHNEKNQFDVGLTRNAKRIMKTNGQMVYMINDARLVRARHSSSFHEFPDVNRITCCCENTQHKVENRTPAIISSQIERAKD